MSSEKFTVYDTRTGAILRTGTCQPGQGWRQAAHAWEQSVEGHVDGDANWHDGHKFEARKPMRLRVGKLVIFAVPLGATLQCQGRTYGPVMDGVAEFSFNHPGEYVVSVEAPAYLPASVTLIKP